jgi:hypothetical protein
MTASLTNHCSTNSHNLETGKPLFSLGMIVATRGVLAHLDRRAINAQGYLMRHVTGDWGDVPQEDAESNRDAVKYGARILSAYDMAGERVWIITEADRSSTTLLFPSEY